MTTFVVIVKTGCCRGRAIHKLQTTCPISRQASRKPDAQAFPTYRTNVPLKSRRRRASVQAGERWDLLRTTTPASDAPTELLARQYLAECKRCMPCAHGA
jgi:hypothetical protein